MVGPSATQSTRSTQMRLGNAQPLGERRLRNLVSRADRRQKPTERQRLANERIKKRHRFGGGLCATGWTEHALTARRL